SHECGVFIDIVSEKLGTVTGDDGTKINVDDIFTSSNPVLYDSIYVVGGRSDNEAKFEQDITHYIRETYRHFKPIGVATSAESFFNPSDMNALPGVVFATNNSNFNEEFVTAIAKQRFWQRKWAGVHSPECLLHSISVR